MWFGDDLGSVRGPLEGAGMDGSQRDLCQMSGCDLGLNHTLVAEGQVDGASKTLTLACDGVPGGAAMANKDNTDHVTFLLRDTNIVMCLG